MSTHTVRACVTVCVEVPCDCWTHFAHQRRLPSTRFDLTSDCTDTPVHSAASIRDCHQQHRITLRSRASGTLDVHATRPLLRCHFVAVWLRETSGQQIDCSSVDVQVKSGICGARFVSTSSQSSTTSCLVVYFRFRTYRLSCDLTADESSWRTACGTKKPRNQTSQLSSEVFCFGCDLRQWRRGACRNDYNTTSARLSLKKCCTLTLRKISTRRDVLSLKFMQCTRNTVANTVKQGPSSQNNQNVH